VKEVKRVDHDSASSLSTSRRGYLRPRPTASGSSDNKVGTTRKHPRLDVDNDDDESWSTRFDALSEITVMYFGLQSYSVIIAALVFKERLCR
jgi:hypothetical protein